MSEGPRQVYQYPCTECGENAFLGYISRNTRNWRGIVKKGERLCTACFNKRIHADMVENKGDK